MLLTATSSDPATVKVMMLHRVDELLGFTIHAADGDLGRVHDLYFDDQRWTIRYLVVDTRHWLPGRRIVLSPLSVRRVDWARREIVVALSREQIRRSPNVDSNGRFTNGCTAACVTTSEHSAPKTSEPFIDWLSDFFGTARRDRVGGRNLYLAKRLIHIA